MISWATLCWHSQCMVGNFWSLWQGLGKKIYQFIVKEDLKIRLPKINLEKNYKNQQFWKHDTKVSNLDEVWRRTQNVLRLEVAVEEPVPYWVHVLFPHKFAKKIWLIDLSEPVHVGKSLEDLEDNSSHLKRSQNLKPFIFGRRGWFEW